MIRPGDLEPQAGQEARLEGTRPQESRPQASREPPDTLAGTIERVTFHNAETGFCVLKVQAAGKRDLVPVVGHAPAIAAGEWIAAAGRWTSDRQHGLQFRAETLRVTPPTGREGIVRYLASGQMRGIGPAMAQRIVALFGADTFAVIEAEPGRLTEVEGIGPKRAARILRGWAEQKRVREIMIFLHAHGVGTARAVRIFRTYGRDAIAVMTQDPYRLARDIRGIGFRTADAIAMRLGMAREAPQRLRAGVTFALQTATDEGHCGLPTERLVALAQRLLEVEPDLIRLAIALELRGADVVADTIAVGTSGSETCLFLKGLHGAERAIADRLIDRRDGPPPWPAIDLARAIPWVEGRTGKTLSPSQAAAIGTMLAARLCVLTGGPGVGKTSTLDSLLRILVAKGVRVLLAAPTGRAAKRMTEQTGLPARTLHRLLEVDPARGGFARDAENPLDCDLLVVDEASMIDVPLMNALLKAVPERAALLLVGDVDQLPSVGPGQVLADLIASERVPVARLTEVFRQAAASRIVVNAHRINRGLMPEARPPVPEARPPVPESGPPGPEAESPGPGGVSPDAAADFYWIAVDDPEIGLDRLIEVVTRRIPARFGLDPLRDIQVLTPMLRGVLGSRNLNHALQQVLNPPPETAVERFGWRFAPGDRVMETQNDYDRDVFNGDLGRVVRLEAEDQAVIVAFDGREVAYPYGELDTLVPAFATTIHKSQGSEYPAVVIPIVNQHFTMLARNLLYTAVTRGRQLVVLVGQPRAIRTAVSGSRQTRRWTKLGQWLRERG
ncbi:ATP-dependent RecD-like DNA helicase [Methylobacterium sp. Leaf125]|uniref:SF1B family DNA helicase RecD2 n=1 Tax=Methylobacterium sp. Leaf125 TaxID=1736265 RepID=UPI0009E7AA0B|nr:ATP-dependent RecD-like DNA helicase [Methylobacterium sp. Leaf125]